MKGIILAGGHGTRLYPITCGVNKHLLPVYDKPMIYYPLSVLLLADIRDILIISTKKEVARFEDLFGDGSRLGVKIQYKVQEKPQGLPEAFIIGSDFIGNSDVLLILGDNIIIGPSLPTLLINSIKKNRGAHVFAYNVRDVSKFGAIKFDKYGNPVELCEKPTQKDFKHAITGIYIFQNDVTKKVTSLGLSSRGELEIIDLLKEYLHEKRLSVDILSRAHIWIDAGTIDSLWEASTLVRSIQKIQNLQIGAIEEIAFRKGWITKDELSEYIKNMKQTEYGKYLESLL